MPIFERPSLDTLAPGRDRWTPIYLEYGRIEPRPNVFVGTLNTRTFRKVCDCHTLIDA